MMASQLTNVKAEAYILAVRSADVKITWGHWSTSLHFLKMTTHNCIYLVIMTKHLLCSTKSKVWLVSTKNKLYGFPHDDKSMFTILLQPLRVLRKLQDMRQIHTRV